MGTARQRASSKPLAAATAAEGAGPSSGAIRTDAFAVLLGAKPAVHDARRVLIASRGEGSRSAPCSRARGRSPPRGMERFGGPMQRRSRFLVRGTFIFELAAECPPDYIRPIKSETYWVDEDDLLLEHADHAGIEEAVRESLEAAIGSLQSKIETARPPPAACQPRRISG